ncbi:MAG: hypothetical protein ACR5K6_01195 [Wolbachia sp.]
MRNSDERNLYQIPIVIGQIKLPVNNGIISAPPPVIPVRDTGIQSFYND